MYRVIINKCFEVIRHSFIFFNILQILSPACNVTGTWWRWIILALSLMSFFSGFPAGERESKKILSHKKQSVNVWLNVEVHNWGFAFNNDAFEIIIINPDAAKSSDLLPKNANCLVSTCQSNSVCEVGTISQRFPPLHFF